MGPQDEMSIGEIGRGMARLEKALTDLTIEVRERHSDLANKVNVACGPVSVHGVMLENQQQHLVRHEDELKTLGVKVDAVAASANKIAGAGALLAVLVGLIPWPWKGQ